MAWRMKSAATKNFMFSLELGVQEPTFSAF